MRPNIPALTSLRFFAAGLVVMAHLIKSDEFYRTWYGHILMDGGDAVVFFFALSGFIMTYVYHTDEFNPAINTFRFWKVRFARIYPAYLLGFIIALPNAAYMAFVSKLISASTFWLSYALSLTMMQGWVQHEEVANGAAWSLSVEIMFYALFPALLIFTGKLGKYSFALLAMTLLVLAHGIKQVTITPEMISNSGLTAEYLYKLPLNHLTTFVAGMAAGRIYVFGPRLPVATHNALFVCGSVLLVGFPVLADHSNPFGFYEFFIVILACIVIYGGAGVSFKLLRRAPLVFLGEASYALYILHLPIMINMGLVYKIVHLDGRSIACSVITVLVCVLSSALCFVYFERPMRKKILSWL